MPADYKPIVTDSNYTPLSIELKRLGKLVDLTGWTVTLTVRDPAAASGSEVIVADGAAQVVGPGRADFSFTPEQVGMITRNSTWLCEWCFADATSGRKLRLAPIRLPVIAKLTAN